MSVSIRYIVNNVQDAIAFYTEKLGFKVDMHPAPGFAALSKDGLKLFINQPGAGGAGQTLRDGSVPAPGGWNRFQLETDNLENFVTDLKKKGASFRNDIITGQGGKQALLQDPSGNLIELFEPAK
ncbi:MAG TPA: VOC family protein [Cyclobacteriaceae bacterium]|nr:VOC family protein [Cyclobacteriaceae bacterium]